MIKYGSNLVGGVVTGQRRTLALGLPVFNTVKDAVKETGATASILFVPPTFAADSAMEAADAGIKVCVSIADGIPSHDMIKVKRYMEDIPKKEKMTLIGPMCGRNFTGKNNARNNAGAYLSARRSWSDCTLRHTRLLKPPNK